MKRLAATTILKMFAAAVLCLVAGRVSAATLWPSDSLTKVMRSDKPTDTRADAVVLSGVRGEIVSGQAVFSSDKDVEAAAVEIADLHCSDSNTTIPAASIKLQWVRYIDITSNSKGIPKDELVIEAPASIPDPFWQDRTIPIKAERAQPVWIEIHVPSDAAPGLYKGVLKVRSTGVSVELAVELHIRDFDLPQQRHVSVINWWKFPGVGFAPEQYSREYFELLDKFCRFVVEHRQTDVMAHLDLIKIDPNSPCDTAILERWAQTAFDAGIQRIHLHSVGYKTAKYSDPAGRIELNAENLQRLKCAEQMVQRRNWQDRFLVSISDEPFVQHEPSYAAAVEQVHAAAPSIKCIEAVEAEYLGGLDIYVPKLSHLNLWYPRFEELQKQDRELWFYVCCHPLGRYPNRFLDHSLLKARVLFWILYLYDLDGYLHWGLNWFAPGDPYTEKAITKGLPPGDRAIAYPGRDGLIGSLRFSAQRDGLQDYEYLWTLEDKLSRIKKNTGRDAFWLDPKQRPLELCRRVIWSFHEYTRDPNVLQQTRLNIAKEIEALHAEPLLVVQTSPPEGTVIPAGPRHVIIRGLTTPKAEVKINGYPAKVNENGSFTAYSFLADDQPTITITATHGKNHQTTTRSFTLTD